MRKYANGKFTFSAHGFNWWDRFWFSLAPTLISLDFGYSRCDTVGIVYFKNYKGRIYILNEVTNGR